MELVDVDLKKKLDERNINTFWSCIEFLRKAGYSDFGALSNAIFYIGEDKIFDNVLMTKVKGRKNQNETYNTIIEVYEAAVDTKHLTTFVNVSRLTGIYSEEMLKYCNKYTITMEYPTDMGILQYLIHIHKEQLGIELWTQTGETVEQQDIIHSGQIGRMGRMLVL